MKNARTQTPESSINFFVIGAYLLGFLGVALLLYAVAPMLGDLLLELKENAAARMLSR